MDRIAIIQGDVKASSSRNVEYSTVLGSCVSICLHDPELKLGGINHFLLPFGSSQDGQSQKYGVFAFESLLNKLLKMGSARSSIVAKVFGGASLVGKFAELGPKNAEFADTVLTREGIPIVGIDSGGGLARRVRFVPSTGEAHVMKVARIDVGEETPLVPQRRAQAVVRF